MIEVVADDATLDNPFDMPLEGGATSQTLPHIVVMAKSGKNDKMVKNSVIGVTK